MTRTGTVASTLMLAVSFLFRTDMAGNVVSWLGQYEGAPMHLHPGDLGWFWRFGAEATAAAVRTWSRDGRTLAVGLLDGPGLVRLAIAPDARRDEELARQLVADVVEPERGVLPEGKVASEARVGALVPGLLVEAGWVADEPDGVVGGPGEAGPAGAGGVHRDHRGHGHGRAVSVAAAGALRERGSSSAIVCTPSSNVGAVATYRSAGFERLPDTRDLGRGSLPVGAR